MLRARGRSDRRPRTTRGDGTRLGSSLGAGRSGRRGGLAPVLWTPTEAPDELARVLLVVEVGWIAGARGLRGRRWNPETLEDAAGAAHVRNRRDTRKRPWHFAQSRMSMSNVRRRSIDQESRGDVA
jgi:hypothetical protein